jgi:hypothetical protein
MTNNMAPAIVLRGSVTGMNRADMIDSAKQIARDYFALDKTPDCIAVVLRNESVLNELRGEGRVLRATFEADFSAQEHHDVESKVYGPGQCRVCKQDSWPQHPLPHKRWQPEDHRDDL